MSFSQASSENLETEKYKDTGSPLEACGDDKENP